MLTHVAKDRKGIEIGAWFAPLVPKAAGYDCLKLDVFDKPQLLDIADRDPTISDAQAARIEEVDLLGSSTEIEALLQTKNLLGQIDYIVSSHNFEHLPNPLKFLQGSGKALRAGGVISMAIPDKRACFDVFRPESTLADWVEAQLEDRDRPTDKQIFQYDSMIAAFNPREPYRSEVRNPLGEAYGQWMQRRRSGDTSYKDVHCWTFTPTSFELLIRDAFHLGLSPFDILDISRTRGHEFIVHLVNRGIRTDQPAEPDPGHARRRQELLKRLTQEPRYFQTLRRKVRAWVTR